VSNKEYGLWVVEVVNKDGNRARLDVIKPQFSQEEATALARDYATAHPGHAYGINILVRQLGYDPCGAPVGRMS
jgi:hypothetical protein